ncbi:MAG: ATP-dependent helicase [Candidatus Dormibacteria bacterium]
MSGPPGFGQAGPAASAPRGLDPDSLLLGLNPAQVEAVTAPDRPVLVLAGAGSGKTRVLTHRIGYLVATGRARPDGLMAVTFTNKAAREMRSRLAGLLGEEPRGMWLGTFHACSARMLRQRGDRIGVPPDFVIYDEADRLAVIKEAMRGVGVDEKRTSPAAVAAEISRAKNDLHDHGQYAASARGFVEAQAALVYPRYQQLLEENLALDFDDLLFRTVRLLESSGDTREHYRARFGHVLVDEYQDTNRAQYSMLRLLVEDHRRVTVVGDPDQSVYSWRGADIRNILEFQRDYPDALVIALEQNYRSTAAILRAAGAVIQENSMRVEKGLWTEGPEGSPVLVGQFYDEQEEASAVAREALALADRGDAGFGDMAVLYRTNAQSRAFEEVLLRAAIPYRLVGGVRFYQRKEVKDMLAYLRLLVHPNDKVAFDRVVNVPKRGIGTHSLQQLMLASQDSGRPYWELVSDPALAGLRGAAAAGLARFSKMISEVAEWGASWPLVQVFDRMVEVSGYRNLVRDGSPEGEERWANVTELRGLAAEQGDTPSLDALPLFLEQLALAGEVDQMEDGGRALTLITLHQVKGLEFPVVFVSGVEEGLLPHSRSLDTVGELEEERRLLYVGMTRAKHRLYLSHCFQRHLYGSPKAAIPSRFLAPLSASAGVERWGAAASGPGSRSYVAPAVTHGQPILLRRASEAVMERALAPGLPASVERRFAAGDRVEHARFGRGTIRESELTSGGEEVVIDFESSGRRRFAVTDAVLRKLG